MDTVSPDLTGETQREPSYRTVQLNKQDAALANGHVPIEECVLELDADGCRVCVPVCVLDLDAEGCRVCSRGRSLCCG